MTDDRDDLVGDSRTRGAEPEARDRVGWDELATRAPLIEYGDSQSRSDSILHALGVLLVAILTANVLVVLGVDLLSSAGYTEASTPVVYESATTALNFVGFLLVAGWYLYWLDVRLVRFALPSRRDLVAIAAGFGILFAIMMGFEVLADVFGIETAENVAIERGQDHPELFLVFLPMQLLLVAPAEELLFRGAIQGLFRRAYGVLPGIALASLLFAAVHIPALVGGNGLLPVLGILFLSGAFLGFLYEYTENLVVPIVVHALWNVLVFGIAYLQAVGTLMTGV